jgi:hypothetical protein
MAKALALYYVGRPVGVQTETATPVAVRTETDALDAVRTETATPVAAMAEESGDTILKHTHEKLKTETEKARLYDHFKLSQTQTQVKKESTMQHLPSARETVEKTAVENSSESSLPVERDKDGTKEAYNDPYKEIFSWLKADIALAKANKQESINKDDFDNAKFFHEKLKALEAELEEVTLALAQALSLSLSLAPALALALALALAVAVALLLALPLLLPLPLAVLLAYP